MHETVLVDLRTDHAKASDDAGRAGANVGLTRNIVKVNPRTVKGLYDTLRTEDHAVVVAFGNGFENLFDVFFCKLLRGFYTPAREKLVGVVVMMVVIVTSAGAVFAMLMVMMFMMLMLVIVTSAGAVFAMLMVMMLMMLMLVIMASALAVLAVFMVMMFMMLMLVIMTAALAVLAMLMVMMFMMLMLVVVASALAVLAVFMVMMFMMLMLVIMASALAVLAVFMVMMFMMLMLVIMASALAVLAMLVVMMAVVVMVMLYLFFEVGKLILYRVLALHRGQKLCAGQCIPVGGDDGSLRIMLAEHCNNGGNLLVRALCGVAEDNTTCISNLIVKEFAEVLHIHFALVDVNNGGEAVQYRALGFCTFYGANNVRKFADTRRLDQNTVGCKFLQYARERLSEVTDERAADAARVHFGDLNACVLHKAAVNADLTEFIFDQNELFARISFFDEFLEQGGFSCTEKARENIDFCHGLSPFGVLSVTF